MKKEFLEKAVNLFSEANSAMISAIEECAKELTDNGNKVILFKNSIDGVYSDPIVQLDYIKKEDCIYAVTEQEDYISLDDLSGNELFEICNHLMAGNTFIEIADNENHINF